MIQEIGDIERSISRDSGKDLTERKVEAVEEDGRKGFE